MALFTYQCKNPQCGETWDEQRDRNDPDLDVAKSAPCRSGGVRVPFFRQGEAPAVYYHGRGWARVDKNYRDGE